MPFTKRTSPIGHLVLGTSVALCALLVSLAAIATAAAADPSPPASKTASPPASEPGDATTPSQQPPRQLEKLDQGYLPTARGDQPRTPGMRVEANGFISVQVNVDENGNNIVGDAANEPSIAVDPTNPLHAAIGWRQFDTVANNFRQAGWGHTHDGGQTWTFPGVIDPGVFRSDPVLDSDADGNFYYNSLTVDNGDFLCDVYRSEDRGRTWDNGVSAFGGDKQWMTIDKTNGIGRGNIYANWTVFYSICDGQFTRSYDGGASYVDCLDVPDMPFWGTIAVGRDGAVYLVGSSGLVVKSSTLQDEFAPVAFDFAAPINLGGVVVFGNGPNPNGLLGQAWIDVDRSGGPNDGNVYVLASVSPGGGDPLDVKFMRSTDGGQTFSVAMRVNDVQDGWQWFGTMSVAPNGRIDVIWNDTKNDPGGFLSELHYSSSSDGGLTWSPGIAVGPQFDPHLGWPNQNKIGDYYDTVSDLTGVDVAYAATYNGEQDVYYLRIGDTDCNGNGIGDPDDIAKGGSDDVNDNGLPDECECLPDFDGNGVVGFEDLLSLLATWGPCVACPQDIDGNGVVAFPDLLVLLAAWGDCN